MNNEKIEEMLSQLIKMVGTMHSEQQEMKQEFVGIQREIKGISQEQLGLKQEFQDMKYEFQDMKYEFQDMKQDIVELKDKVDEIETKSDIRHKEIIGRFKSLERDQDFIWEKAVRNEREIASLKTK